MTMYYTVYCNSIEKVFRSSELGKATDTFFILASFDQNVTMKAVRE